MQDTLVKTNQPTTVRILGSNFKIVPLGADDEPDNDGSMSLGEQTIRIRNERALGYLQDTMLHETIHAIDETLYLKMSERQVAQLATVLLAVLKDNKNYTNWLLQDENR